MLVRRLGSIAALVGVVVGLASCSQLGQATGSDPLAIQHTYVYTAIGASDAVGFGSTVPCATAPVIIGPDTELMPSPPNCPGGRGYIPGIASRLTSSTGSVVLTDLGISGAAVGPTERTLGNTWEPLLFEDCTSSGANVCIPGDFLSDELPLVPGNQDLVTIFAGGNDTEAILAHVAVACNGCNQQQIRAMITADVTNFANDYLTLIGAIHQSHPFARIYVANLPNFGLTPRGVCIGADPGNPPPFCGPNDPALGQPGLEALLDAISTGIDANVINQFAANGIPVIDTECDPRSYDPSNFYIDGFHPDDAGYALLAQLFTLTIKNFGGPPPAGNCQFSQAIVHRGLSTLRHVKLHHVRY
ncbi:MAG TPA: GDSL-type esterase/lipase family protein [Candidatus Eremiobacteraceae bacterium]|nr:GDSL-type esterase/lipase family protein [Candidatus Eremiobacteraceae bacterium]